MRTELRIVAGALRRRTIVCNVHPKMRPTPQRVREALFSLLTNVVEERPFIDVFAGTGINGLEALSRGASRVLFVERDFRLLQELQQHLKRFELQDQARMARTDAYRWAERWEPPEEPVNVFISPPFPDIQHRPEILITLLDHLTSKVADESVVIFQGEDSYPLNPMPAGDWDDRKYGRNHLLIWKKQSEE